MERYTEEAEPSPAAVVLRISAITLGTVGVAATGGLPGGLVVGAGVLTAAVGSAVTSYKQSKIDGVLADGRMLIIQESPAVKDDEPLFIILSTYEVDDDGST